MQGGHKPKASAQLNRTFDNFLKSQMEHKEKTANNLVQRQNQQLARERAELRNFPKINPKSKALASSRSKASLLTSQLKHNSSLANLSSSFVVIIVSHT